MLIADLHIHSHYSRATSRECTPEQLDFWAARKGIGLVGTGDFTHPAWRQELRDKLSPAEDGLYVLREDCRVKQPGGAAPRFVLSAEISSIYKKNGRVRKVHNVILMPGLDEAEALSRRLEAIGNIHSDGRPILGLDSRDLLEITLDACPQAVFIPAHIWTPHFSLFGAFSGFDTIEECFEDLTPYIHAVETGLSSDPPMNWRVSALDRLTLVSNSDAHSPQKLGREANLLDIEPSFAALSAAIAGGQSAGFAGTIEFFPEEGKYHLDGHRNCGVRLTPTETQQLQGKCPVCGRKITIGVEHRVEELADRPQGTRPTNALPFESLVPLPEVIAASTGKSPTSKKTLARYEEMLCALGTEFDILRQIPIDDIERAAGPCVAEGIRRLRAGQVERIAGYDGEYGVIHLLSSDEIERLNGQVSLPGALPTAAKSNSAKRALRPLSDETAAEPSPAVLPASSHSGSELNERQREAVEATEPVISVVAGPGTGKTKTLVERIAALVEQMGTAPGEITAVTFTNQAAEEMRQRLKARLGKRAASAMTIGTFHSICLRLLEDMGNAPVLLCELDAQRIALQIQKDYGLSGRVQTFLQDISRVKCGFPLESTALTQETFDAYCAAVSALGALDFDDLLVEAARQWEEGKHPARWVKAFHCLLVDEFQDINSVQYRLLQTFCGEAGRLFVIGDPDQSIYGFRGSNAECFDRLVSDRPDSRIIRLEQNYRSTPEILRCALPVISRNPGEQRRLTPQRTGGTAVRVLTAETPLSEGIFVSKEIGRLVGGVDMLAAQAMMQGSPRRGRRRVPVNGAESPLVGGFSDIAVLYRTHRQAEILEKCLRTEGIPYSVTGKEDYLSEPAVQGLSGLLRLLCNPDDPLALTGCLEQLFCCPADLVEGVKAYWLSLSPTQPAGERLDALESEYRSVGPLLPFFDLWRRYLPRTNEVSPLRLVEQLIEDLSLKGEPVARFRSAAAFAPNWKDFIQILTLGQEGDFTRASSPEAYAAGAVRLMTLHGSKGLEFPVVFLCGAHKGQIPLESPSHPCNEEEERRLFYVGMTRARDQLIVLTSPEPSPFLADIPPDAAERGPVHSRRGWEGKQLSLF